VVKAFSEEERCKFSSALIPAVDECSSVRCGIRSPTCKRFYCGLSVGKDIRVIPINIEDEGAINVIRVEVSAIFVSLNKKPRFTADVDW
jgi:hypothetical protein